jgi:hypothetical protein
LPDGTLGLAGGDTWTYGFISNTNNFQDISYDSISYNTFLKIKEINNLLVGVGLDARLTVMNGDKVISRNYLKREGELGDGDLIISRSVCGMRDKIYVVGGKSYNNGRLYRIDNNYYLDTVWYFENQLNDITNVGDDKLVAIGYGTVYTQDIITDADHWKQSNVSGDNYSAVYFLDSNNGWICGFDGSIQYTNDGADSWTKLVSENKLLNKAESLNDIYFRSELNGIVVGDQGVILISNDGGESWKKITTTFENNLKEILHHDNKYFIVGDEGLLISIDE